MATLSVSNPFFIRCIKPNMEKVCFFYPMSLSTHIFMLISLSDSIILYYIKVMC